MEKRSSLFKIFLWGILLWFIGYILGIIFYGFVPKDKIGYFILPIGLAITLFVLFKKINLSSIKNFINLGVIWALIAIVLDYLFIVILFQSQDYYKLDVYLYYFLTLIIPVIAGYFKLKR